MSKMTHFYYKVTSWSIVYRFHDDVMRIKMAPMDVIVLFSPDHGIISLYYFARKFVLDCPLKTYLPTQEYKQHLLKCMYICFQFQHIVTV